MTEPLQSGQRLGAYRIIRPLGVGGMGQVYEAEHVSLGVRRALKVFTTESHHIDFLRKRFIAEGRILADLDHPRIVHVYDLVVDDETGTPYFAMDLMLSPDGTPRTLENEREAGVSEEKVAMWFKDICEGLAYIHSHKVVHRDISLDNILIGPDGHAVISDFGIAKIVDDNYRRKINVTVTMASKDAKDLCMGKGNYMAPELKRGGRETPASDAYALGVLLFRLLTGFWYEPNKPIRTQNMLAGFAYDWWAVIKKLCAISPFDRLVAEGEAPLGGMINRLKVVDGKKLFSRKEYRFFIGIAAGCALGACICHYWLSEVIAFVSGSVYVRLLVAAGLIGELCRLLVGTKKMFGAERMLVMSIASLVLIFVLAVPFCLWVDRSRPKVLAKESEVRKDTSAQGVAMYSADGRSLVRVPDDLQELIIPEGVLYVTNNVFPQLKGRKKYQLKRVAIPSTLPFKDNEKFEDFIRAAVGKGCREFVVSVSNRCYRMDGENFMMTCDGRRIFCFVPTTEDCRIPEGVERIDAHWPNFKTIYLPSTFRYSCERFPSGASISVSDRNDNFMVKDGRMLMSRDGKRIEQYTGRDKVFAVDEGVEEISPDAYANIKRNVGIVVMPRSLRKLCKSFHFGLNIVSDHIGNLQAICFKGSAPEANYDIFWETVGELRVYVTKGSQGWCDADGNLKKKWPKEDKYGRSLLYWDGADIPTPDDKLASKITDANLALSLSGDAFLYDDWSAASEFFDAAFHGSNEILSKEWDLGSKESFLMEMMAKAEEPGDPMCMFLLGWWFERGGIGSESTDAQNPKMAANWYQRGADKGDAWCMAKLGDCYARGFGVTQDGEVAFKYYTKAAGKGLSIGMSGLGDCYFNGIGTATNREEAVKWYLNAAERNNNHWDRGETAEKIAQCFKEGIGVPKDLSKAREWEERSKNEKQKRTVPFVSTNRVETTK